MVDDNSLNSDNLDLSNCKIVLIEEDYKIISLVNFSDPSNSFDAIDIESMPISTVEEAQPGNVQGWL